MPKPKDKEVEVKDTEDKKVGSSIEEVLEKMKAQDEMLVSTIKRSNDLAEMLKAKQAETDELKEQMGNITNLLGNLAERENSNSNSGVGGYDVDEDEVKRLAKIADEAAEKKISAWEKNKTESQKAKEQAYLTGYRQTITDMLDEEDNPKGDPLDSKSRADIIAMLNTKEFNQLDGIDAPKEARRNFKAAYKRYFSLDRKNQFKGGNPAGTGVGGEFKDESAGKEEFAFSDAALKQLERAKITREEAERLMARRREREALV